MNKKLGILIFFSFICLFVAACNPVAATPVVGIQPTQGSSQYKYRTFNTPMSMDIFR